jgi:hypothetical protein
VQALVRRLTAHVDSHEGSATSSATSTSSPGVGYAHRPLVAGSSDGNATVSLRGFAALLYPARELTISPLILPWWYQIPTQCKRPKVLLVHALPRGHLSSSPDALLPILSSRPPQLCQLRHARLLPPPTGDSIQTLRLRWPCPQTLRAAERVDVQRSARALNRSPHYAEPCRLRPLVRLAFDPLTVMWFPPAGRWR